MMVRSGREPPTPFTAGEYSSKELIRQILIQLLGTSTILGTYLIPYPGHWSKNLPSPSVPWSPCPPRRRSSRPCFRSQFLSNKKEGDLMILADPDFFNDRLITYWQYFTGFLRQSLPHFKYFLVTVIQFFQSENNNQNNRICHCPCNQSDNFLSNAQSHHNLI